MSFSHLLKFHWFIINHSLLSGQNHSRAGQDSYKSIIKLIEFVHPSSEKFTSQQQCSTRSSQIHNEIELNWLQDLLCVETKTGPRLPSKVDQIKNLLSSALFYIYIYRKTINHWSSSDVLKWVYQRFRSRFMVYRGCLQCWEIPIHTNWIFVNIH